MTIKLKLIAYQHTEYGLVNLKKIFNIIKSNVFHLTETTLCKGCKKT